MISFPNCKINLGLHIIGKRPDGYHDLETAFYPIPLKEALELVESDVTSIKITGLSVPGNNEDNLCLKAYRLLKNDFPHLPPVQVHLHKAIPTGAGLGGGSADGAFMLMLLDKKFELQLTQAQLIDYALQLGSDCPFFIINKPVFATGRGEKMSAVDVDLSGYTFVIVNPQIHISTRESFALLTPKVPVKNIEAILQQPINTWKDELINDFEKGLFQSFPEIEAVKMALYNSGAVYASMTGTGSTVFGIFDRKTNINLSFSSHYLYLQLPAA